MTVSGQRAVRPPQEILLGFTRALRAAGVEVSADRERAYLRAVSAIGIESAPGVLYAGQATLCSSPSDIACHDLVFGEWFGEQPAGTRQQAPVPTYREPVGIFDDEGAGEDSEMESQEFAFASETEVLRQRDLATLTPQERLILARMFNRINPRAPKRLSHRRFTTPSGTIDARRTMRDMLRRMGEPGRLRMHARRERPREIVLIIDVSGSMSDYSYALLRLAQRYAATNIPVEVFTLGTRVTRVTRALRRRNPDHAVAEASEEVADWSGGTRLADGLARFLKFWGRGGMARGAVVVILSDGWEMRDPHDLGEQVRRIRSLAHRVVWVNPHRGKEGYSPIQSGIIAVLPHCDHFLAGHSFATFEVLTHTVAKC